MDKLIQEEGAELLTTVEPLRHYLVKYIFPTLTKGLIEVAKLRPEDPIDFLVSRFSRIYSSFSLDFHLYSQRRKGTCLKTICM